MTAVLTTEQVRLRIEAIRVAAARDHEAAHGLEDALYAEALAVIAGGHTDPQGLAREVLRAGDLDFPRHCA